MSKAKKGTANLGVKGFVKVQVVDTKKGKVVGYREIDNLILNQGRDKILTALTVAGIGATPFGAVGSSTASPADATLVELVASLTGSPGRKSVSTSSGSPGTAQFMWGYVNSEYVGQTFGEVGVGLMAGNNTTFAANNMACRATFATTAKTSDMAINFTYQLFFSAT